MDNAIMACMIFAVDNVVKNHEKQNQYISASTELKKTQFAVSHVASEYLLLCGRTHAGAQTCAHAHTCTQSTRPCAEH